MYKNEYYKTLARETLEAEKEEQYNAEVEARFTRLKDLAYKYSDGKRTENEIIRMVENECRKCDAGFVLSSEDAAFISDALLWEETV